MDDIYADRSWESEDGLALHYRDYAGSEARLPVLCLHGLTRNARDFADLAARIAPARRAIVPDMRGRGDSDYAKDSTTYNSAQYVRDIEALLAEQGVARFVAIGTSLGGLVTMMMAAGDAGRIAGAVLNDIGPAIATAGVEHIRSYVGQGRSYPTWMHAARALSEVNAAAHPGFGIEDWLAMAKRTMVLGQGGRISYDYDMAIAEPLRAGNGAAPADMWPAFAAMADTPLLLVRGADSNMLSVETVAEMQRRAPNMTVVTLDGVGHAPLLSEPAAATAVTTLLDRLP